MKSSYLFSPSAPGAVSWKRLGTGDDKAEKGVSWRECVVKALGLIQIHDRAAEAFPVGTEMRSLLHSPASAVPGDRGDLWRIPRPMALTPAVDRCCGPPGFHVYAWSPGSRGEALGRALPPLPHPVV